MDLLCRKRRLEGFGDMKILLVEDEVQLSNVIAKGLSKLSYVVEQAFDGEEALELLYINSYNLVVLDLNLPKIDGLEVLKRIRERDKEIKVIILSARNMTEDKVRGLELGANDYMEKPFDFKELVARIDNLLRWSFIQKDTILDYGDIKIDSSKKLVYYKEEDIELTNKEYGILEYLAYNDGRLVSSEEIMEHVWGEDSEIFFSTSFQYHMSSLRKKLRIKDFIKNVRGQGYFLNIGDEDSDE